MERMDSFWGEFLEIVQRCPDAVAVEMGGKSATYSELSARAASIGEYLRKQGVSMETPVALEMEKSTEYIAAMLGCWYAGAAFIPLPPSLPQERRDDAFRHADIRYTLTTYDLKKLPRFSGAFHPAPVQQETLAYIIYTSGSTGAPKGVMVEHRGIVSFIKAQISSFQTSEQSRCLFYLSILFDAAISDIGVALLSGARLVIPTLDEMSAGTSLVKFLRKAQITHMDVPPALLKAISPKDMPESLRTIIIGGEACPPDTVRLWAEKFRVVNVYGPTEATVCTSLCVCNATDWNKPLLGDPLPGISYAVLDAEMREKQEGELYIAGVGVARGYLKQPALTREKFIERNDRRFYKTGDRVIRHANGALEFLGRMDRQFKLRGQLVEPEEIETRLMACPSVKRAAVIKKDERLVAFIDAQKGTLVSGVEAYLKKFLPGWMIPQHFEWIENWPLTTTGKTDYAVLRALPLKEGKNHARLSPATEAEKKLWQIWLNILKHDDFGVTDDFFSVGGDSLGVISMTLDAERHGIPFSIDAFASGRTIRALAESTSSQSNALPCDWLRKNVAFNHQWLDIFAKAKTRPIVTRKEPVNIFLTGATGFLGGRLLAELLKKTKADIYCLVRSEPKLKKALENMPGEDIARIHPVYGDMTQPHLGIQEQEWQKLSKTVDTIYHCAATVNMALSYQDLRASNIAATEEVLRLACEGRRKRIHYASTLSVFVATDQNTGSLRETDRLESTRHVYGGYAQTKWAAEWMLLQAPKEVCDITHYRFGLMTGDTVTGVCAERDFLAMFAKGIAHLQIAPKGFDDDLFVDITPVDYAAAAMAHLSLRGKDDIYHIANPKSLSLGRLLSAIERKSVKLQRVSVTGWKDIMRNRSLTAEETAAWLALCRVLPGDFGRHRTMDLFQATDVAFDTTHANTGLKGTSLTCPLPTDELLTKYMDYIFKA